MSFAGEPDIDCIVQMLEETVDDRDQNGPLSRKDHHRVAYLIEDWRAKKAEIERLRHIVETDLLELQDRAAEAMRSRCEAIARDKLAEGYGIAILASVKHGDIEQGYRQALGDIAAAIAALKTAP